MNFELEKPLRKVVIEDPICAEMGIKLEMLSLDEVDSEISGNKWFKLKYNIQSALEKGANYVLTFGGAFSNHIAATASACNRAGLRSIGVIRGEPVENSTLNRAKKHGMEFKFISRGDYRRKESTVFLKSLMDEFPGAYIIPEGGSNLLGVKGASEILEGVTGCDLIACPVGTGGTLAGIIQSTKANILGFPALKNNGFLNFDIQELLDKDYNHWRLINDYHFGGYAKFDDELISFIRNFRENHGIQLEPIYTGKMMYGLRELVKKHYFQKGTKILAIHTGGLQGLEGFRERTGIDLAG